MREEMKKLLFVGIKEEKKAFFESAQERGLVHFIDPHSAERPEPPRIVEEITKAIKVLRGLPPIEQEENDSIFNAEEIVHSILSLQKRNEQLLEELRLVEIEISRIHVLGDFSFTDINYI